jgi:hypothetical protein
MNAPAIPKSMKSILVRSLRKSSIARKLAIVVLSASTSVLWISEGLRPLFILPGLARVHHLRESASPFGNGVQIEPLVSPGKI